MACTLKVMDDPLPTNVEFRTNHTILSCRQPVEVEQWWRREREREVERESKTSNVFGFRDRFRM